jgi:hypothetical protein
LLQLAFQGLPFSFQSSQAVIHTRRMSSGCCSGTFRSIRHSSGS